MKEKPTVRIIAGDYESYRRLIQERRGNNDAQLCQAQSDAAKSGWVTYDLCATFYGWSIRYASGLQNFGLIRGSMTLREAVKLARAIATKPNHVVTMHTSDIDLRRRLAARQ